VATTPRACARTTTTTTRTPTKRTTQDDDDGGDDNGLNTQEGPLQKTPPRPTPPVFFLSIPSTIPSKTLLPPS
jgi:hypothetical protein